MRDDLILNLSLGFLLKDQGYEDGVDDWENDQGEKTSFECWWGVFGRILTL
jgi:hypothetical protein